MPPGALPPAPPGLENLRQALEKQHLAAARTSSAASSASASPSAASSSTGRRKSIVLDTSSAGPSDADIAAAAMSRFGLKGKKVLITGGTRGIGKAVAITFAELGAQVIICARNKATVEAVVEELKAKGLNVQGVPCDVSDRHKRLELIVAVKKMTDGALHVLINNVGTNIRKPTEEYSDQDYARLMSTNLESAFHLCQLCYPLLKASGDGCVLFDSSVAGGPTAMKSGSIYAMTKASLNQLAKNLACEWAADRIRVNSVAPWYTATELANQVLQDKSYKQAVLARTPLKRIAAPEEVAATMAFLASKAAAFITGQTLAVDGGYSVMGFF